MARSPLKPTQGFKRSPKKSVPKKKLQGPLKPNQGRSPKKSPRKKSQDDFTSNDGRRRIFSFFGGVMKENSAPCYLIEGSAASSPKRVPEKLQDISALEQTSVPAFDPFGVHTADFVMNRSIEHKQRHEDDDITKVPSASKHNGIEKSHQKSKTSIAPTKVNALNPNNTALTPKVTTMNRSPLKPTQGSNKGPKQSPKKKVRDDSMLRLPLKPTQGKNESPKKSHNKKLNDYSTATGWRRIFFNEGDKENSTPIVNIPSAPDASRHNEKQKPDQTECDDLPVETYVTRAVATQANALKANSTSFTPRVAMLEEDTAALLARVQASYKTSHGILKEIQREQADLSDLSPLSHANEHDKKSEDFGNIAAYCEGKLYMGKGHGGVQLDAYQQVSSYCAEKAILLANSFDLEATKNENDDLMMENDDLRKQIEFKSACLIQAHTSISSLMKLLKEKEDALDAYDEIMRMNDSLNSNIVAAVEQQRNEQVAALNEKLHNSSSEIKELDSKLEAMERNWCKYKDMCKVKDRQLESAVSMSADLDMADKENTELKAQINVQSNNIESLTNANNELNEVITSLTTIVQEKEQALDDWANFTKMNEEASKKMFEHFGRKHYEELEESNARVDGLVGIIKRQKFGESEYLKKQLLEKVKLEMEVEAMKLRLDSYDLDDRKFTDIQVIIALASLSSGLLLMFWSYIVADNTCL